MAMKIYIQFPIWKTRSVGINQKMIKEDRSSSDIIIEILHKKEDGGRLYPYSYKISKDKALQYPVQIVGKNTKLHIIPIADLGIETEDEREERELKSILI